MTAPAPRPSATVVLLSDAAEGVRVLLVRRSDQLAFHGGAWVFPGGAIDAEDGAGAGPHAEVESASRAACRELREEAAIDVAPDSLVWLSRWTTPEGRPKRFVTWFFLGAHTGGDVRVDGREITESWWARPAEALAAHRAGRVELPPPTFVTLTALEGSTSSQTTLAAAAARPPEIYEPRVRTSGGGRVSLYAPDAAYAGGELDAPGPRHRLWMLGTGWRYERSARG